MHPLQDLRKLSGQGWNPMLWIKVLRKKHVAKEAQVNVWTPLLIFFCRLQGKHIKVQIAVGRTQRKFWYVPNVSNEVLLTATVEKNSLRNVIFWTFFSRCRPHIKVNYTKGNWYESTIIWSVWLCNQLHHQTIQWSIPKGNIFISLCHLGPVFPTILYILGHQLTHQIWNNTQENGMTKFIPWLLWGSVFPNVWFDWDIRSSIKY